MTKLPLFLRKGKGERINKKRRETKLGKKEVEEKGDLKQPKKGY